MGDQNEGTPMTPVDEKVEASPGQGSVADFIDLFLR